MGADACTICKKSTEDEFFFRDTQIQPPSDREVSQKFQKLFNSKINELGQTITKKEFINSIDEETQNYIEQNAFNKEKYAHTNDTKSYEMGPVEFKNGNIYEGNWNEKLEMHGYGKYLLKNDKVFVEGYWDKGILKQGRIFLPNGDIYEGEIENNEYDGKGKYYDKVEDSIYEGTFIKGERNKNGVIIFHDGSMYEGDLIDDDVPNGKGKFKWIDSSNQENSPQNYINFSRNTPYNNNYILSYEGDFENGVIEGNGILKNEETGSEYKGGFKNNVFDGKGVFKWGKSGIIKYDGEYKNGKKNGNGTYSTPQMKFSGNWNEGEPHGLGLINKNNQIFKCSWRNGFTVESPSIQDSDDYETYDNVDLNFKPEKEDIDFTQMKHLKNKSKKGNNLIVQQSIFETS
jgi:hypothetical protein